MQKLSYPSYEDYTNIPHQYDTNKWLQAIKTVYYMEKNGASRQLAIKEVTAGWGVIEVGDFLNWLKFYEGGNHLKYKFAQLWYTNDSPGYFLHIKKDEPEKDSKNITNEISSAKDAVADELSDSEKKRIIERQRNKIIGRLDSAEKLLRTHEGQLFAGKDFESLLETLYTLKKKIQMINKISFSTRLYEDLIVREANILNKNGFIKAADLLYSIADGEENAAPVIPPKEVKEEKDEEKPSEFLLPTPPPFPQKPTGDPGGVPLTGSGAPQPQQGATQSVVNDNSPTKPELLKTPTKPSKDSIFPDLTEEKPKSKGMKDFTEGMAGGNVSDLAVDDDALEVDDSLEIFDVDDGEIMVEAQLAPPSPTSIPVEKKPLPPPPLEVSEEDIKPQLKEEPKEKKDFDHMIDSVFSNITISDIVEKLEYSSNFFRKREIPRQLAIVDLMLNSVGLSSVFPTLSEATNKALESNNYILTRVDDILSRLRGIIKSDHIDMGKEPEISPEMEELKEKIERQDKKEKEKKELRKQLENKSLEDFKKEEPEIEIGEDLEAPVEKPKAPPAPPKPPIPTPPPAI
jgi:hypothetical protein